MHQAYCGSRFELRGSWRHILDLETLAIEELLDLVVRQPHIDPASLGAISVPTLVRLLKSGEIPCRRGGQRWLIAQSVLDDWLKQKN